MIPNKTRRISSRLQVFFELDLPSRLATLMFERAKGTPLAKRHSRSF